MGKGQNYSKPKKKRKIGRRIGVWFLTFLVIGLTVGMFSPKDADGNAIAPSWYGNAIVFIPVLVALFYDKIKWSAIAEKIKKAFRLSTTGKSNLESGEFIPPRTKAAQKAVAEEIIRRIETNISLAKNSCNVLAFIGFYNEVSSEYSKLEKLNKIEPNASLMLACRRFKDEFQLHLCNTIVRQKNEVISGIKGKYKNSREFQRKALEGFEHDLHIIRDKLSMDTAQLADESCDEIRRMLGIRDSQNNQNVSMHQQFFEYGGVDAELLSVDLMEGRAFEEWCADILRRNGYMGVEVTPGSGDQGVDVLATKEDVRFAIQCKRYNSDLGNTPVQEVIAGRKFYHCQVGVVMTNRYFTAGAKELAESTGTLLWDRDKLREFIQNTSRP